jgi:hypothetical protein
MDARSRRIAWVVLAVLGAGGLSARPAAGGPPPAPGASAGWVSGTVVDEEDHPLAGADARVVREKPAGMWSGTSDAKGFFKVMGVPPGPAKVIVSAKGRVPFRQEVTVPVTGVASVQAKLGRGVRFAGKLVDLEGKPVAGARLVAYDASEMGGGPWRFLFFSLAGNGGSGADGSFEVDGLAPGTNYTLRVLHPRYARLDMPGLDATPGGGHGELEVTLEPAAWVTGTVVDTQGRPVSGARVSSPVDGEDVASWWGGFVRVFSDETAGDSTTDARGRFLVGSLGAGEAKLTASADAYFPGSVVLDDLATGKERCGVRIVLEPATAWVDGLLVDDLDKPVAGADLSAEGDQGTASTTKSDAQGRFKLARVRSRSAVTVRASHEGNVDARKPGVPLNTAGLRLVLPRAARLKVRVLGPDGKLVEQVNVHVEWQKSEKEEERSWSSHAQGEAGLDVPLPVGEVTVEVSGPGLARKAVGTWTTEPAKAIDGGVVKLEAAKPEEDDGE